jgi:hypothetical protein
MAQDASDSRLQRFPDLLKEVSNDKWVAQALEGEMDDT